MSGGSSNSNTPDGLAPVGGLQPVGGSGLQPVGGGGLQPVGGGGLQPVGGGTPAPTPEPPAAASPIAPPPPPVVASPIPERPSDALPPPPPGRTASRFTATAPVTPVPPPPAAATPAATPPVAAPAPAAPPQVFGTGGQQAYVPPTALNYNRPVEKTMEPKHIVGAVAGGILVGIVALFFWMALVYFTHFPFAIVIGGGVGWAIGWGVFMGGSKRGDTTACAIGGILAFVFIALGLVISFGMLGNFSPIIDSIYSLIALGSAVERGYRVPEVSAANDV